MSVPISSDPPFNPVHAALYSSEDLLAGFDANDQQSLARTPDFLSYVYFEAHGRTVVNEPYVAMMQALHDASIARAMYSFLADAGRPVAAIMGGHAEGRDSATFKNVVLIAKKLTEEGFLVASGGGPGCMEATHLGALLARRANSEVDDAIAVLKGQSTLPKDLKSVFAWNKDTGQWVLDEKKLAEMHAWALPAVTLARQLKSGGIEGRESLAVPTWHYGHEPLSPLATHVAKYFLNSIREDVLLALATNGIVFTRGRAGTLQEVFQDAAQNYYEPAFSSMVFFEAKFWSDPPRADCPVNDYRLPVKELLHGLFVCTKKTADERKFAEEKFNKYVRFTDSVDEVVEIMKRNLPEKEASMKRLQSMGLNIAQAQALTQSL